MYATSYGGNGFRRSQRIFKMKYNAMRGTRDIFGKLADNFNFVENQAKQIFQVYGYQELRTPIFEASEVFLRSLGENTDIVSKEIYLFKDKGDRTVALRPEGTAPIVRAALENNLITPENDERFFYMGPMFRYDRPQAGRYRQFYQIGAEIFGHKNPLLDAEIIKIAHDLIKNLEITDAKLQINSVGCPTCRPKYLKILQNYLAKTELCPTCNERKNKNVLRVFDCKIDSCQQILKNAPTILDHVCENCATDFANLQKYLTQQKIDFSVDKTLVRGLDYYTGMVFEILKNNLAIAAGGRYDNLVEQMGGKNIPAVGFALGEDRVVEILNIQIPQKPIVFMATTDPENHEKQIFDNFDLIENLRNNKIIVRYNSVAKSIKSQFKTANNLQAAQVILIETNGTFSVKNMQTGAQENYTKKDFLKNAKIL